ncbi:MAG: hypothetical protein K6L60_00445 [Oceanobacter sp.]
MKLYWLSLLALGLFSNFPTFADDTEIYVSRKPQAAPNVIFVMDTSGSMGSSVYTNGVREGTRLEVVQKVAVDVINSTSGINIAIMRLDRKSPHSGGWLSSPLMPIDGGGTSRVIEDATPDPVTGEKVIGIHENSVRTIVKDVLYSYTAAGATPITETLAEASAYLRGDKILFERALYSENTDLCLTWEERLVPVKKGSKTIASSSHSVGIPIPAPSTAKATIDKSVWWFKLPQDDNGAYLMRNELLDTKKMAWKPWNKIPDWIKKKLKKTYKINKSKYAKTPPEWWMVTEAWMYRLFRDSKTGKFKSWDDLARWEQRTIEGSGLSEAVYRANTESVSPPPDPDPEVPKYEKKLVCVENLNLDSAHDGKGNWVSPMTDECQSSHVVLFSDGSPTSDSSANTVAKNLLKKLPSKDFPTYKYFSTSCSGNGGCAEELAYAYHNLDNASHLKGHQPITIHTIGGFISGRTQDRMNDIAHFGGGIAQEGSNAADLRNALKKVFDSISQSSGSFAAPALTVNAYNSLEHSDQLYYSLFKPEVDASWGGNLKRYRLGSDGKVQDAKGLPAIDPKTGYFAKNATSFWTLSEDAPDGEKVESGGAARRLTSPDDRKVVSYLGSTKNLMDSSNRISANNGKVNQNKDLFNSEATDENFLKMLQWAQGYDTTSSDATDARRSMEDPLHSRPILVNYGTLSSSGGKSVADSTVFVGTNSGYLHAFHTNKNNPKEDFSFIPQELLPNIKAYYERDTQKVYGMDGHLTVYHKDSNGNNIVDTGEDAFLYAGMRRGGRSYYALDIGKRNAPKFKWRIQGGTGDFKELGQTWSRMVQATVVWKGKKKEVLFFGGGYDPAEDNNTSRKPHQMGNAIYMIDPDSGALLWKASKNTGNLHLSEMTSGIAGDIVPVDDDSDGDVDILYAADLGGRIWRIDLIEENSGSVSKYAKGGVIADLGSNDTTKNHVRFYTTPDIIYTESGKFKEGSSVVTLGRYQIAMGSGYRAHPLNNDTTDNIYIINDFNIDGAPDNYKKLTKSDLADYANYESASTSRVKNGLYYKLPSLGEKILSKSLTVDGTTYMVSYRPSNGESRSGCDPDIGYARTYLIKPRYYALENDSSGNLKTVLQKPTVVKVDLKSPGIPPTPIYIRPPRPTNDLERSTHIPEGVMIRTELLEHEGSEYKSFGRSYWREY